MANKIHALDTSAQLKAIEKELDLNGIPFESHTTDKKLTPLERVRVLLHYWQDAKQEIEDLESEKSIQELA